MHTAWTLVHGKMMHGGEPWPKTGPAIFSFAHGPKPIEIRFVPSPLSFKFPSTSGRKLQTPAKPPAFTPLHMLCFQEGSRLQTHHRQSTGSTLLVNTIYHKV